ncbi:MAG: flippase-like domain-containing protein [Myxococcales bacterium]|nr:flippase-like domain-containing protein [Myxococcales bacterium]
MERAEVPPAELAVVPGRRRWLHALALVIGVAALSLLVQRTGWSVLSSALARIGPWFALVALIDLAAVLCDAGALHSYARVHAEVSFGRVFAAQASGLAINRLTPGNALGEPIKVTMLLGEVPRSAAVSSVVMFNVATMWCAVATILLGVPVTLLSLDLPLRAQVAVWCASAVLLALAVALFVVVRKGALGVVIRGMHRLGLVSAERGARWQLGVVAIDADIRQIGRRDVRRALFCVAASRLLYASGTILLMAAAGLPLTAPLVLATVSVGILITWISNIVPLGLGIADGSNYALYGALGASGGAGLVFTMVNRARTILLALLGLTIMGISTFALDDSRRE